MPHRLTIILQMENISWGQIWNDRHALPIYKYERSSHTFSHPARSFWSFPNLVMCLYQSVVPNHRTDGGRRKFAQNCVIACHSKVTDGGRAQWYYFGESKSSDNKRLQRFHCQCYLHFRFFSDKTQWWSVLQWLKVRRYVTTFDVIVILEYFEKTIMVH